MHRNTSRVLFGLVFVAVAVVVFGNTTGLWNITNFNGWWTLFLIVPGVAGIIDHGFDWWDTALVVIGAWLLAASQNWVPWRISSGVFWTVILLVVGLELLFGRRTRIRRNWDGTDADPTFVGPNRRSEDNDSVNHTSAFGTLNVENHCRSFRGGNLTAVFGRTTLDLRNAQIMNGAAIDALAFFGGIELYVPENCRVELSGTPILGGASCRARRQDDPALPLLLIRYTSIFGGVEAK